MNSKIEEVIDHIRGADPDSSKSLDEIIRSCAAHGFSPVQIMAGLQLERGIVASDAKKVVSGHPLWSDEKAEWQRFHEELEQSLNNMHES